MAQTNWNIVAESSYAWERDALDLRAVHRQSEEYGRLEQIPLSLKHIRTCSYLNSGEKVSAEPIEAGGI